MTKSEKQVPKNFKREVKIINSNNLSKGGDGKLSDNFWFFQIFKKT